MGPSILDSLNQGPTFIIMEIELRVHRQHIISKFGHRSGKFYSGGSAHHNDTFFMEIFAMAQPSIDINGRS